MAKYPFYLFELVHNDINGDQNKYGPYKSEYEIMKG